MVDSLCDRCIEVLYICQVEDVDVDVEADVKVDVHVADVVNV